MSKRNQRMYRTFQAERLTTSASLISVDKNISLSNETLNLSFVASVLAIIIAFFR